VPSSALCAPWESSLLQHFKRKESGVEKDIDNDVLLIKEFLRHHIGTTYAQATSPSDTPFPQMDMSEWGGTRNSNAIRNGTPWRQMETAMHDYRSYVERKLGDLCVWHKWV
jgi:hypothetical protein